MLFLLSRLKRPNGQVFTPNLLFSLKNDSTITNVCYFVHPSILLEAKHPLSSFMLADILRCKYSQELASVEGRAIDSLENEVYDCTLNNDQHQYYSNKKFKC